jgi:hypothetical protein
MEVVQCLLVFMIEGDDVGLDGGWRWKQTRSVQ